MECGSNYYDLVIEAMRLADKFASSLVFVDEEDYLKKWDLVFKHLVDKAVEAYKNPPVIR